MTIYKFINVILDTIFLIKLTARVICNKINKMKRYICLIFLLLDWLVKSCRNIRENLYLISYPKIIGLLFTINLILPNKIYNCNIKYKQNINELSFGLVKVFLSFLFLWLSFKSYKLTDLLLNCVLYFVGFRLYFLALSLSIPKLVLQSSFIEYFFLSI